jgi:hypothetical protein
VDSVSPKGVQEVGVGVHSLRDGGVAQQCLDLLGVLASLQLLIATEAFYLYAFCATATLLPRSYVVRLTNFHLSLPLTAHS